jgi:hypothetical protein
MRTRHAGMVAEVALLLAVAACGGSDDDPRSRRR